MQLMGRFLLLFLLLSVQILAERGKENISYDHQFQACLDSLLYNRRVGRAVTRSSLEREVQSSNLGPVKSNTVSPTVRHCCCISSRRAVLPANSLRASRNTANIIKDLILICFDTVAENPASQQLVEGKTNEKSLSFF